MFPKFSQGLNQNNKPRPVQKRRQRHFSEGKNGVWSEFQSWYTTRLGKELFYAENQVLETCLPDLFGYYLLQSGCPEIDCVKQMGNWLHSSRVSCQIRLDPVEHQLIGCLANPSQLPVKADSLDIVVLPHVLEFSNTPHQVLREVERVLIAEGHVVILGFNPLSIWNLFRFFLFWKKQAPWNAAFLTSSRVMDWLVLLGFDVIQRQGYFYRPPFQNENVMNKMGFFERLGRRIWPNFGAGYMLVARKRVETLTPIRPRWRSRRQVVANGLEPMNRNKM